MLKKFVIIKKGVVEIMKSKEMQNILTQKAKEIENRLPKGYESDIYVGKTRANASIGPKTKKARIDNYKNNTLLKAVK